MVLYKYIIDEANGSSFLLDHVDVRFLSILSKNNKISKEIWLSDETEINWVYDVVLFLLGFLL